MIEKDSELSRKISKIVEMAVAKSFKCDFDELNLCLNNAENECKSLLNTEEEEVEVKRRIGEWRLRLYCDRNLDFQLVEKSYKNLLDLGYSNIGVQAEIEIYYASYLLRSEFPNLAKEKLESLLKDLENLPSNIDISVEWLKQTIDYCKKLLSDI